MELKVKRAAIKRANGKVTARGAPFRHWQIVELLIMNGKLEPHSDIYVYPDNKVHPDHGYEMGFELSDGTFVSREDAFQVALSAGQVEESYHGNFEDNKLYSEDLW